jgi:RNA polymerase sigma-70 factor (sigma-E family)
MSSPRRGLRLADEACRNRPSQRVTAGPPVAPRPRPGAEPALADSDPTPAEPPPAAPTPAEPPPAASALAEPAVAEMLVPEAAGLEREAALARLFDAQYTPMLRLAVLLGADDAEDVVAEAFYQLYRRWQKLRNADAAVGYLRSVVVNLARMRLRHLQVVRKHIEKNPEHARDRIESAEHEALLREDQRALVGALKQLPARQREALVLRYWLGLKEIEIASAMGISAGAVKSHTARGMAALTRVMEARR